jgi:hypothetical protein
MAQKHDIPDHLIPSSEAIVTESEAERELNEQLDTERWVYTSKPDDALCPYCGCEYKRVSWASNYEDATKGVCPYDTSISDFIVKFVHKHNRNFRGEITGPQCFCGPAYDDTFVTFPCSTDYDIKRF